MSSPMMKRMFGFCPAPACAAAAGPALAVVPISDVAPTSNVTATVTSTLSLDLRLFRCIRSSLAFFRATNSADEMPLSAFSKGSARKRGVISGQGGVEPLGAHSLSSALASVREARQCRAHVHIVWMGRERFFKRDFRSVGLAHGLKSDAVRVREARIARLEHAGAFEFAERLVHPFHAHQREPERVVEAAVRWLRGDSFAQHAFTVGIAIARAIQVRKVDIGGNE